MEDFFCFGEFVADVAVFSAWERYQAPFLSYKTFRMPGRCERASGTGETRVRISGVR
jgi:hypothetical protein